MRPDNPITLPINYLHMIQGVIYNNMHDSRDTGTFYHDNGYKYEKRQYRMFCFSWLDGHYKIDGRQITFTDVIFLQVRSPDVSLIRTLESNIRRNGIYFYDKHITNVSMKLENPFIDDEEIVIQMLTSLSVYTTPPGESRMDFYSPLDEEFSVLVHDNFIRKYKAFYGISPEHGIEIEPIRISAKDKRVVKYKDTYISGWLGVYVLRGDKQGLNFIYQTGLGSKNSQGFGLFELQQYRKNGE